MLTTHELKQLRSKIDAEYQKDIEALDRLARFLPGGESLSKPEFELLINSGDPNANLLANGPRSVLGGLESILSSNSDRTWTVVQLKSELEKSGYELLANNPNATISVALKKLVDRGKVLIVRHGSGREPHIYQAARFNLADCEVIEREPEAA